MVYTKINGDKVDEIMKRFSDYCGVDFTYVFDNCYTHTEINLGTHAIDFREFVELETGYYITDNDWINIGVFTWEKLVEHLNKSREGILASFKVAEKENFSIPYNPVKNISIEKYYRCSKGAPSQCEQFYSGNGILFMSESDCGKYYYWEDYNSKNELIFFRGEKSWVEANYQKVGLWEQVITPAEYGVAGVKKVVDLGEFTLTGESVLDSPSVSDQPYRDFSNMVNSLDDTKRITLKGTLEEKKAALLKELSSEDKILATFGVPDHLLGEGSYKCTTNKVEDEARRINSYLKQLDSSERVKNKVEQKPSTAPIKSDGGKSDYYKIELPKWLLDKHSEKGFIMLEDLAEIMFENDFNFTNVFKAQKRMFELTKGQGKAGNDFEYDATKCKYYTDKQVEVFNRNKK